MSEIKDLKEHIKSYYINWFKINDLYNIWAERHNLSDKALFVLEELNENMSGCSAKYLCETLVLPKQTISFILSRFEKQGYIYRERNPKDHRNKLIKFTKEGLKYAQNILNKLETAEIKAYSSMTQNQRESLTDGLYLLRNALEKSFLE